MDINTSKIGQVQVITIVGDIDGSTAPQAQNQILALADSDIKLILDMTSVPFMSSAGLRMLLLAYRTITGKGGKVVLVGLSEDLKDTMSMTGFLDFFTCSDTLDAGLEAISL